jgi:multidrug resistance efflux pump
MDLLIILTYAAVAYAVFRIFRIPVNGFTLLTAALGGITLVSALVLGMNYNHPFSSEARFYFNTTPIVPVVPGKVIEVAVQPDTKLKAGDVLFKIEPDRYANAVKAKQAALEDARQAVAQLRESADSAQRNFEAADAQRKGAQDIYERSQKLVQTGAISQAQFKQSEERFAAAQAAANSAQSEARRAALDAAATIGGVNTDVARLEAELATAQYELDQTVVRAPTDGVVLQNFLRPGMYAASLPLRPVMIFMHEEPPRFAAAFLQNSSQRILPDAKAEVILPAVPGRFFKARVVGVGEYIPQGQLQPSGNLINPEEIRGDGRVIVEIEFEDDLSKFHIVPGSTGNVAIYTHHMHHLAVMRKVLLRMKSWMNFLFSDGH